MMRVMTKLIRAIRVLMLLNLAIPFAATAAPDPKIVEGAKKEGQLVWYNTLVQPQAKGLIDLFMQKYPFINATFWRGGAMAVYSKLTLEARAGRYDWDALSMTNPEFVLDLKQKNLIGRYLSPERGMFSEDLKDQEGFWTGYYALPTGLGFNVRQVRSDQVPKTYQDLLAPVWKGKKISIDTEGQELLMGLIQAWGKEKAVDYMRKLSAQDPALGRGNNKRIELAAAEIGRASCRERV